MHVGDICNLGIACVYPTSDRNLLDFIQEAIDPTTGCAHIAFADDNTVKKLRIANQTSGCFAVAAASTSPTPTAAPAAAAMGPLPNSSAAGGSGAAALVGASAALLLGIPVLRRRRRRGVRVG
jgi:hypothetical protein